MSYLDSYVKRVESMGESVKESQINRSKISLDKSFKTSPSFYVVEVNDEETESIVLRTRHYDQKKIYFKSGYSIQVGSVVKHEGNEYLILEKDRDRVYNFGMMTLCNAHFKLKTGVEEIFRGTKPSGEPVYEKIVSYKEVPCIVDSKYYSTSENASLPLPEGKLSILIQYQEADNLVVNHRFSLYEKDYVISDLGYVHVIDGVGYMEISAERVIGSDE